MKDGSLTVEGGRERVEDHRCPPSGKCAQLTAEECDEFLRRFTEAAPATSARRAAALAQSHRALAEIARLKLLLGAIERSGPPAIIRCGGQPPDALGDLVVRGFARERGIPYVAQPSLGTRTSRAWSRASGLAPRLVAASESLARLRLGARAMGEDLLTIAFQPNSFRALLSLAPALAARNIEQRCLLLASDAASVAMARARKLPFSTVEAFLRPSDLVDARPGGAADKAFAATIEQAVAALDLPGWLPARELSRVLYGRLRGGFLLSLLEAYAVQRALCMLRPRHVLFGSDHPLVATLAEGQRPRPRSSLFLQGVIPSYPVYRPRLRVDDCLVGSRLDMDYCKYIQARHGCQTVGYAQYDHFRGIDAAESRQRFGSVLGLGPDTRVVLFTSQYSTPLFDERARLANLQAVLDCARAVPDHAFIVKSHPRREPPPDTVDWPKNAFLAPQGLSTEVLLSAADVAVTYWSTTALEAVLLRTPLIQLNATGLPDFFDLSGRFEHQFVRSAEELARRVTRLAQSAGDRDGHLRAQEDFLKDNDLGIDASSSRRVVDALFG